MTRSDIIYIVFRFINLALLAGIFVEAFKRVVYPVLKQQVTAAIDAINKLYERIAHAADEYQELEQTLVAKKAEGVMLLHKVKLWRVHAQKEHERYAEECSIRAHTMGAIHREQETNFITTSLRRTVGAQVLEQTRALLQKQFANEQEGKRFLDELCRNIQQKGGA